MLPVQFFLFGLFLAWFTGTGKLGALLGALRKDPPAGQASVQTPGGVAIIDPVTGQPIVVPGAGGDPQIAPGVG